MRRILVAAALAVALPAAPARAHDHGDTGWSPATGGPRLGLSAADVLARAPLPGDPAPRKLDLLRQTRTLTASEERRFRSLGRGRSGGRAIVHRGGRVITRGPLVQQAPSAQLLSTGYTAAEPTMGVAKDGTLFYVGLEFPQTQAPKSFVLRSTDEGRTWQELDVLVPGTGEDNLTLDPFLYLDDDTQRLFNVDLIMPCSAVSYSDDKGDSFSTGAICNHTDHQNLFTGPPTVSSPSGYPNVVYYCSIDGGALGAYGTFTACSKSLDGGTTFVRTRTPAFVDDPSQEGGNLGIPGHCAGATGHGIVDSKGTIYLPRGYCGQPYLGISRDEGDTWERVQVADIGFSTGEQLEEHEASVAADADGNLYYTWAAVDRLPYLVVSRDGGTTWGKPIMIAPPGVNEAWDPFLDTGDPGRLAIIYMGTTNSPGPPYCVRTTPQSCTTKDGGPPRPFAEYEKTTWNGYMASTVDALSPNPTFFTTTVNDPADPLVRGTCGPLRCQQEFDFLDVHVHGDGTAYAPFVDGCTASPDETAADCALVGTGIVGHLVGGPPLVGPLPPPVPAAVPPPPAPAVPKRCTSRRSLTISLGRGSARGLRAFVDGKRVKVRRRRGRRLVAIVPLRRLPAGSVQVRVVRKRGSKSSSRVKRVRTCRR